MRFLGFLFIALTLTSPVTAQTWPDLTDDAGVQGGGEQDAALIVGVTDYYNLPKIDGAAQNAEAWQQWLLRSRKVPSTRVELLTDKLATREKIERNLEQLGKQVGPKGTLWFIFIGHGAPNKTGTDGLLLGVDTDGDSDSLSARGVSQDQVLSLIGQGKQAHSVVVFDACFSGKTGDGAAPLVKGLMATLPNRKSAPASAKATVLAASDSFAGPLPNADRPAFSYLLLGALRGWADDNGDKAIDVDEAHEFTRSYIQRLFKGSDRLPSKRGPSVVLAKNVKEKQPDMAALVTGKCPSGWTWAGRECKQQAVVECPGGTTWNGSACVSLCPAGTSWNGRACAATSIECPAGTSWNGTTCAASSVACPSGTTWNGTACEGRRVASLPAPPSPSPLPSPTPPASQGSIDIKWVSLPGGTFHYGCEPQDSKCDSDEKPGSTQRVAPFSMAQTETTVRQYQACVTAGACQSGPGNSDGGSDHPVVNVDWHQATAFCQWAGGRLPSAVEWEYAAKGGTSRIYPWGNLISGAGAPVFQRTAPVGSFPEGNTTHGLQDMAGNVWEWTSSSYDSSSKEIRGGSWDGDPPVLRASSRGRDEPALRSGYYGFRCAQ
jgi:formylglycine-generating enzyme required for sulfatase activity